MNPSVSAATKAQIPLIQQGALHNCYILSNNGLKKSEKIGWAIHLTPVSQPTVRISEMLLF